MQSTVQFTALGCTAEYSPCSKEQESPAVAGSWAGRLQRGGGKKLCSRQIGRLFHLSDTLSGSVEELAVSVERLAAPVERLASPMVIGETSSSCGETS